MSRSTNNFLLLGGGSFLFHLARYLLKRNIKFTIFTDDLHLGHKINDEGTLHQNLEANGISYFNMPVISGKDIEKYLSDDSVGFSLSAHWIFRKDLIDRFKGNFYNVHISRLPKGRGGGGPTWKILSQNRLGGVTIHKVSEGIDDGAIAMQTEFTYPDECVIPSDYYEYDTQIVNDSIIEFVERILAGDRIDSIVQDNSRSEYFPRINTAINGYIDWNWSAEDIRMFINAFDDPHVGASTFFGKTKVHLKKGSIKKSEGAFHPFQSGIVYRVSDRNIFIAAQGGAVVVKDLLDENGKDIKGKINIGMRFHTPAEYIEKSRMTRVTYNSSGLKVRS